MEELLKDDKEDLFIEKDKHKFIKIFISILLILGMIGGGGYYYYQNYWNNPQYIITTIFNKEKKALNKKYEANSQMKKFKINGLSTINIDCDTKEKEIETIIDILNGLTLQVNGEFDTKLDTYNVNINTKYQDKEFINLNTYIQDNQIYVKLNNIFDKYVRIDNEQTKNITKKNIKSKDVENILNTIIDTLQDTLSKQEFKRKKEKISIDNKEYNVYNNYLVLKDKEINDLVLFFLNNIQKNQDFLISYKKIFNQDIEKDLNDLINYYNENIIIGNYKISFYTTVSLFNTKLISIQFDENIENEKSSIIVNLPNNNEITIDLRDASSTILINIKTNDNIINNQVTLESNKIKATINGNFNIEEISSISTPDLSNAINIDEITEQDSIQIQEKIANNEAYLAIMNAINSLLNNKV